MFINEELHWAAPLSLIAEPGISVSIGLTSDIGGGVVPLNPESCLQ